VPRYLPSAQSGQENYVGVFEILGKAGTTVLIGSVIAVLLPFIQGTAVGGTEGGILFGTLSVTTPTNQSGQPTEKSPGLNREILDQGTNEQRAIMRPDGSIRVLRKSPFTIENGIGGPRWLHLGVEHRTRYETYNEPFRLNQDGSDQQLPFRTLVRLGIRYDPIRFLTEFMDARAFLTDNGSTAPREIEDETDILQLLEAWVRQISSDSESLPSFRLAGSPWISATDD
jgi:hypothetical protein